MAKELLAHVADSNDPAFSICLNALKAMYLHCGDSESYRLLASPEMLIAKAFFNETIPAKEETNKALMQIAFHLAKNPSPYIFKKFQRNLNLNRDHVLDSENFYALSMLQLLRSLDPSAVGWKAFATDGSKRQESLKIIRSEETSLTIAAGLIVTVHQLLTDIGKVIPITYETLYDMSSEFVKKFPEYIALSKYVFENLLNTEFNMLEASRSNFLWDTQLMLNVGEHTLDGNKLYFVTDDKAIVKTAIANNAKYSILTFNEYLEYIN